MADTNGERTPGQAFRWTFALTEHIPIEVFSFRVGEGRRPRSRQAVSPAFRAPLVQAG